MNFLKLKKPCIYGFLQKCNRHTPISGDILKENAKFFYKKMTHKDDFKDFDGWIDKLKKHFAVKLLCMTEEKLSYDVDSIEQYKKKFQKVIQELSLTLDQVCNADKSGSFWRLLPKKYLFSVKNRMLQDKNNQRQDNLHSLFKF